MHMDLRSRSNRAKLLAIATLLVASAATPGKHPEIAAVEAGIPVLWRDPVDLERRDLYFGPGGKASQPRGNFRFVEEDKTGSTPKFEVVSDDGTKWKAKLGVEARPETVASRLLWSVGYFANEDYFMPELRVQDMPQLHRGSKYVGPDGMVHGVRLKRHIKGEEKIGIWSWRNNPFSGTREWYGLRVLMAVINNWDLKDENNSVYRTRTSPPEAHYVVSDLGASFGTTGLKPGAKGDLDDYRRSKWFRGVSGDYVDFNVPSMPGFGYLLSPAEAKRRPGLTWIGHRIPITHARWMGSLLARLSSAQIRDAFRAGGYSPSEVEGFTRLLQDRIRELCDL